MLTAAQEEAEQVVGRFLKVVPLTVRFLAEWTGGAGGDFPSAGQPRRAAAPRPTIPGEELGDPALE